MSTHNTHYATTRKSTKVTRPFFKRYKLKLRCSVDSWHGSLVWFRTVEIPRPYVSVNFAGNPVSTRLYLYDFARCLVAEKYFDRDSSCCDFHFSDVKFVFSATFSQNLLSGFLGDGNFTFDFNYVNVDRGCDCVSCGRCEFRLYEV